MAQRTGVSAAEAADRLDRLVHQILSNLRQGRETRLGGLGIFRHGPDGGVVFEREGDRRRG